MVDSSLRSKVKPPAIALIVLAALGVLYSLFTLLTSAVSREMSEQFLQGIRDSMAEQGAEVPPFLESMIVGASGIGLALAVLNTAVWGFVLFGAVRMIQLRSRSLCVAAAVAALLPTQCCCGLGIAFGIWALIVLNRPDVRTAFADA